MGVTPGEGGPGTASPGQQGTELESVPEQGHGVAAEWQEVTCWTLPCILPSRQQLDRQVFLPVFFREN
jgi:hypothetical protein